MVLGQNRVCGKPETGVHTLIGWVVSGSLLSYPLSIIYLFWMTFCFKCSVIPFAGMMPFELKVWNVKRMTTYILYHIIMYFIPNSFTSLSINTILSFVVRISTCLYLQD